VNDEVNTEHTEVEIRAGWTGRLWDDIAGIYDGILDHPFITELSTGELDVDCFVHFLSQDTHYLQAYVRTLLVLAAKAPEFGVAQTLITHAVAAASAETTLHAELMSDLGRDPAELTKIEVAPTTAAYASYMLSSVHSGSFADGLATIMPCFWIYAEVGQHLKRVGSANPVFQRWIDSYGSQEYRDEVTLALDLTDQVGQDLGPEAESRARQHFHTAARYEWMFWDAAYRQEAWPI
jgi:thiaminase/transcriptional activator TenA